LKAVKKGEKKKSSTGGKFGGLEKGFDVLGKAFKGETSPRGEICTTVGGGNYGGGMEGIGCQGKWEFHGQENPAVWGKIE